MESTRVLFYAETGGAESYTGKLTIYTGKSKKLRELPPVPRLVVSEQLSNDEYLLMHCSSSWKVLAVTRAKSIVAAKELGESAYRGLTAKWVAYRSLTPEETSELEAERRVLRQLEMEYPIDKNGEHAA